jgi:RNA-dependent RNA polymerase
LISSIQVEAVDKPELHEYTDVIIFSTDGSRSQASKEGGGDYDGDIDIVIWDPRIVTPFHNASHKYLNEPHGLPHHFDSAIQRVSELMDQCHRMVSVFERTETLQTALVAINYDQSLVGLYSHLHNIATYKLGYGHDTTWRLAYM